MLVLGGIDLPAQSVGGFPEGVGVGEVGDIFVGHATVSFWEWVPAQSAVTSRSQQGREQFQDARENGHNGCAKGSAKILGGLIQEAKTTWVDCGLSRRDRSH